MHMLSKQYAPDHLVARSMKKPVTPVDIRFFRALNEHDEISFFLSKTSYLNFKVAGKKHSGILPKSGVPKENVRKWKW